MNSHSEVSAMPRTSSRLRELRLARGWTIEDLASRAGTSSRTIYSIEGGEHRPQRATRQVLALALGCRPEDLETNEAPAATGTS